MEPVWLWLWTQKSDLLFFYKAKMKHTRQIKSYSGTHEQLAEEIGDLYYDSLADFLRLLSTKILADGEADKSRGRKKLATQLFECSKNLEDAASKIDVAWKICEPYMKK